MPHSFPESDDEMALYGSAQHRTDVHESNVLKRIYGSPQHETATGLYPCSGSELARPTTVYDSDSTSTEPTGSVENRTPTTR